MTFFLHFVSCRLVDVVGCLTLRDFKMERRYLAGILN